MKKRAIHELKQLVCYLDKKVGFLERIENDELFKEELKNVLRTVKSVVEFLEQLSS